MNTFDLELSSEVIVSEGEQVLLGKLSIDSFTEEFHSSISYWDRDKYLSQWKEGLNNIVYGNSKSAIITTMYDPITANFIFCWVMYLVGNDVFIQNHVLFMEDLKEPFDERKFAMYVPDRETVNEDGDAISEWRVSVEDIREALAKIDKI